MVQFPKFLKTIVLLWKLRLAVNLKISVCHKQQSHPLSRASTTLDLQSLQLFWIAWWLLIDIWFLRFLQIWEKISDCWSFSDFKTLTGSGLEKTPVRSSGTSTFSLQASNFLSLLAPRARTQASHAPAKFLLTILRRKGKFSAQG